MVTVMKTGDDVFLAKSLVLTVSSLRVSSMFPVLLRNFRSITRSRHCPLLRPTFAMGPPGMGVESERRGGAGLGHLGVLGGQRRRRGRGLHGVIAFLAKRPIHSISFHRLSPVKK